MYVIVFRQLVCGEGWRCAVIAIRESVKSIPLFERRRTLSHSIIQVRLPATLDVAVTSRAARTFRV